MKLSKAQLRLLRVFPREILFVGRDGIEWGRCLFPSEHPKYTYPGTVGQLYKLGLVEPGQVPLETMPLRLTQKGRDFLLEMDKKETP